MRIPSRLAMALLLATTSLPALAATIPAALPAALAAAARSGLSDLGVVVDVRRVGVDGLLVLAVTPGGPGERMGLRPGDRIVAANGRRLAEGGRPSEALAAALAEPGRRLRLEIVRDGRPLVLEGDAGATADARPGCGYVRTDGPHPRSRENVFPVYVVGIDGEPALPLDASHHRLDAGPHVLVVRERVDDDRFTPLGLDERARQRARHGTRLDKVLIVDVEPDTTYAIGAKTSRPIPVRAIADNSYWEPVVWRTAPERCE